MENLNILWIDDDINSMSLKPYLDEIKDYGYEIYGVENPDKVQNALEKCFKHLSLIIIDISMPLGNSIDASEARNGTRTGLVLLKQISANRLLDSVPIIVFTIVNDQGVKEWCDNQSIPYLHKQTEFPETLLLKINKIIKK